MADPSRITLAAADTWEKVASSVRAGYVFVVDNSMNYFYTYRLAGGAAPTTMNDALPFEGSFMAEIDSSVDIDVYVLSAGAAGTIIVNV